MTASTGRSRGWLMPDFSRSRTMSRMQTVVLSAPVPAVVGTATRGLSGRDGAAVADRPVDLGQHVVAVDGQQVDRLGGVDRGAATDRARVGGDQDALRAE